MDCIVCGNAANDANWYCAFERVARYVNTGDPDHDKAAGMGEVWRIHFCDECWSREWFVVENKYVATQGRRIPVPA